MVEAQRTNSNPWRDLPRRLATICIGIPCLWMLWGHSATTRLAFWEGVHLIVAWEWSHLSSSSSSLAFMLVSLGLIHVSDPTLLILAVVLVLGVTPTLLQQQHASSMSQGILLISLPFRSWLWVCTSSGAFPNTVSLLLTVWNCDTGALVVGRCVGGRFGIIPLAWRRQLRQISPSKSVEGLLGGFVGGVLTYMYMVPWLWNKDGWLSRMGIIPMDEGPDETIHPDWLVASVLSALAILGDLWESQLKRHYQVKDTGKLLPGHGGVLDRFDSSLLAILAYHFYLLQQQ